MKKEYFKMCDHLSFPLMSCNFQEVYYFGTCIDNNGTLFDILAATYSLEKDNRKVLYEPKELNPELWECIQTVPQRANSFSHFGLVRTNEYRNGAYNLTYTNGEFPFVPFVSPKKNLIELIAELESQTK